MTRKAGETPEEEFEDAVQRFIDDEEALDYLATNDDWFTYLDEVLGVNLDAGAGTRGFMTEVRERSMKEVGVQVWKQPVTGTVQYRFLAGEVDPLTGKAIGGQFMSKGAAEARMFTFLGKLF